MFQYGIGGMFGVPNGGNLATPSFPQRFGTLQDTNVDIDQKLTELRGQNKFPDDIAPGDMSIKGKAGFARLDVNIYNALYFADAVTTGMKHVVDSEAVTAAASVVVGGGATFVQDLGVAYADGSGFLQQTTSGAEAAGKYSVTVATGTYVFAGTDLTKAVLISYVKTDTTGLTLTVKNHIQGYGPTFELWLMMPYQGNNGLHLFACRASKMSAPLKKDGYAISDFEFQAYANGAGKVFEWFQA